MKERRPRGGARPGPHAPRPHAKDATPSQHAKDASQRPRPKGPPRRGAAARGAGARPRADTRDKPASRHRKDTRVRPEPRERGDSADRGRVDRGRVDRGRGRERGQGREERVSRIAGEAAVAAVFATAPERIVRLFFEERLKGLTGGYCAVLANLRRAYRVVSARIALATDARSAARRARRRRPTLGEGEMHLPPAASR